MTTGTAPQVAADQLSRRSGDDRRAEKRDRRKTGQGLFELRAKQAGQTSDRRQTDRREAQKAPRKPAWYEFWRRRR